MCGLILVVLIRYAVQFQILRQSRSNPSEVFLEKGVLKICSKFTGEHPWRSVNLLHIFRTPFPKNTSEWLLLVVIQRYSFLFQSNQKLTKNSLKFHHKFRITIKSKSECIKGSNIRKKYLRLYQKSNHDIQCHSMSHQKFIS